jgi:hypothetical protein
MTSPGSLSFLSPERAILDPDNLYHRCFLRVLVKPGMRRFGFMTCAYLRLLTHPKRSLDCDRESVKEQMGRSSIQVTVDIYGHLIRRANLFFVDKLDELPKQEEKTTLHQSAPGTHQPQNELAR